MFALYTFISGDYKKSNLFVICKRKQNNFNSAKCWDSQKETEMSEITSKRLFLHTSLREKSSCFQEKNSWVLSAKDKKKHPVCN